MTNSKSATIQMSAHAWQIDACIARTHITSLDDVGGLPSKQTTEQRDTKLSCLTTLHKDDLEFWAWVVS
jgi:hypothetical protein